MLFDCTNDYASVAAVSKDHDRAEWDTPEVAAVAAVVVADKEHCYMILFVDPCTAIADHISLDIRLDTPVRGLRFPDKRNDVDLMVLIDRNHIRSSYCGYYYTTHCNVDDVVAIAVQAVFQAVSVGGNGNFDFHCKDLLDTVAEGVICTACFVVVAVVVLYYWYNPDFVDVSNTTKVG